jgi:hypothetical protein
MNAVASHTSAHDCKLDFKQASPATTAVVSSLTSLQPVRTTGDANRVKPVCRCQSIKRDDTATCQPQIVTQ